eukprot:12909153-Prorocentrum_lima.AAC.1
MVEFYRAPSNKDQSGWRGPATTVHVETYGTIHLKWQGPVLICQCRDVYRALVFWSFIRVDIFTSHHHDSPYSYVL